MSLFSTTIKVPLSILQDSASKLSSYADDNSDIFDRLLNILTTMESSGEWTGESMTAALTTIQSNQKKFEEVVSDLSELSKFLTDFTTQMSSKDSEIASQIRKVV
jgi:uncharacterized protein YukE